MHLLPLVTVHVLDVVRHGQVVGTDGPTPRWCTYGAQWALNLVDLPVQRWSSNRPSLQIRSIIACPIFCRSARERKVEASRLRESPRREVPLGSAPSCRAHRSLLASLAHALHSGCRSGSMEPARLTCRAWTGPCTFRTFATKCDLALARARGSADGRFASPLDTHTRAPPHTHCASSDQSEPETCLGLVYIINARTNLFAQFVWPTTPVSRRDSRTHMVTKPKTKNLFQSGTESIMSIQPVPETGTGLQRVCMISSWDRGQDPFVLSLF